MGPHLMRRPPKFVHGFIDRHGKPRFYFRRPGFKPRPLPGLPWSPEFMAAYERGACRAAGADRQRSRQPGTIRALAVSYFNSTAFRSMQAEHAISLPQHHRSVLRGEGQGGHSTATSGGDAAARAHRQADGRARRQAGQRQRVAQGVAGDDEARRRDRTARRRPDARREGDPRQSQTASIAGPKPKSHNSRGSIPSARARDWRSRSLLYTGQRRSDVVRMGRQHIRDGVMQVRQQQDRRRVGDPGARRAWLPSLPRRRADHLTFLTTQFGKPFTASRLRQLVPRAMRRGGAASLQRARAAEGRGAPARRGRLHRARDRGDHRPRQLARGRALHEGRGSKTACGGGDGEGQRTEQPTVKPAARFDKKRKKSLRNQSAKFRLAPRAGFEPATNRLTAGCSTAELPGTTASCAHVRL